MSILSDRLSAEILQARQRVYTVGEPTPLQRLNLPGIQAPVYAKREDLGPIRAYKWRGAFNCMAALSQEARDKGIVAASAGNHAQGVALAARVLNCHATIFMPRSTPEVKQTEVRRHGGRHVKIMLHGDCYDETAAAAHEYTETHGCTFVHPYDDLVTMAGQGTLADEVVMSGEGPFDRAYVAIGGGGLASGVAYAVKALKPTVKVIGVQAQGAASMVNSLDHNQIESLASVLTIADGIAVKEPGVHTFEICQQYVDEVVQVSEDEICAAILALIEHHKLIAEGAGAVSVAAAMFNKADIKGKNVCCIVSGGNIDVTILSRVINRGLMKGGRTTEMLIEMPDRPGSLLGLCNVICRYGANIISIHHERNGESPDVNSCNLRIVLETRNSDHIRDIHIGIESAGYAILQEK